MVPRSMLKEWALHTFPNATDYWTFRKMFTIQLALIGLAEFMLHLNRLNPEMLQIAQVGDTYKHTCVTLFQGQVGSMCRGPNSIDVHSHRCIKRSPYLAVWITILPHDIHATPISQPAAVNAKDVLTERYIQSLCSTAIKDVSIWRGRVCVCVRVCLSVHTHPSGARGPQTAFSKSLLKMIVSVGHPSPLILIGLCWQAFLRAAKHWY